MYDYISFKENYENKRIKDYMNIITYCDGSFSIFDIAIKLNINLEEVISCIKILKKKNIVT